jgi:hypothetical protein
MKIEFWFIVALVSIHTSLALAKEHDEVMKEQWLEDPQRDEVERDLQARIIDGDRVPIDTYVSHCDFVQKLNTHITFAVQNLCC